MLLRRLAFYALASGSLCAQEDLARVRPVLARYCQGCHNASVSMGSLDLAQPVAAAWPRVADKLAAGQMPPAGSPRPSSSELALVLDYARRQVRVEVAAPRVTAHRLNRVEYNNTVRDLLGVSLRPADEFPLDDAGYGFDNIGDVLSVSPLLMEKYLAAARRVSQAAIYGSPAPVQPTKLIRFMTKKSQDDPTPRALPFSHRGALYGSFDFPVTGVYELRMRVGNYRPRVNLSPRQMALNRKRGLSEAEKAELDELNRKADPPVKMVLTVDGKEIYRETVEGNIDYQYAHGESIGRVRLTAGEHSFRASFPEFAALENPLENMNLDGRRKLFVDYLDVVGPFEAAAAEPPAGRSRVFVCAEKTAACASRIIESLARRAYRRPVSSAEVAPLVRLAAMVRDSGDSFDESIRVALQAMLVSPRFLFRFETDDAYDLASRLSYFLWSTMPDEALLEAAPRLREPAVLEAQVRRMLADAKADALVENFAGQWLGLRQLAKRVPDAKTFPRFDDELLESMRRETELFARAVMREDRSVLDFLDGRFSFVNGPLARHYGLADVGGEEFVRVSLDGARGGVLTQGAALVQSSYATRTSPVLRGRWVLDTILGAPPPPAPPDVPALREEHLGAAASLRERLEQHRANPNCAVCHNQMDGIGFALENFDAVGAWRDRDGRFAIDNTGSLPGADPLVGPDGLRRYLRTKSGDFVLNITEKMLTYATGRGVERADRGAVAEIARRVAAREYRFSALVMETVKSPAFLLGAKNAP